LPVLAQLVEGIEAAFPNTAGAQKLEQLRNMLMSAFKAEQGAENVFSAAWPTIQAAIAGIVAVRNATGVFKTGGSVSASASS
jgi:hypothetical protein